MIELKQGAISNNKKKINPVSFSYEKGSINYLDYEQKYIYSFLRLKDQSLESGEFIVNDFKVYPSEESDKAIVFLAINSIVNIGICLLFNKQTKDEEMKKIQEKLIALKDMPLNTEVDKKMKISAIFEVIKDIEPQYMLVDLNDDNNFANYDLNRQLEDYKNDFPIIVLNQEVIKNDVITDGEEDYLEIGIGDTDSTTTVKKVKTKKKKKVNEENNVEDFVVFSLENKSTLKNFWLTLKNNLMVFASFVIPTMGVVAFSLLTPLYAKTDNKVILIPFIITILVCFVLYTIMTYRCTNFQNNRNKATVFFISNLIFTLTGYGLGYLTFFLFKTFDSDIKTLSDGFIGLGISLFMVLILITQNLYLRRVLSPIISKFKKNK